MMTTADAHYFLLKALGEWIDRTFTREVREAIPDWYEKRQSIAAALLLSEYNK